METGDLRLSSGGRLAPSAEWLSAARPVLFTFDDGPQPGTTDRILDILGNYNIPAVFFVSAERCCTNEAAELLHRIQAEGHIVGSHGYDHIHYFGKSTELIELNIRRSVDTLDAYIQPYRLFRPPYGEMNAAIREVITANGLNPMFWNTDPEDWRCDGRRWVERACDQLERRAEAIVVLHDVHEGTAQHLEEFIEFALRKAEFAAFFGSDSSDAAWVQLWDLAPGVNEVWRCPTKARVQYLCTQFGKTQPEI